MSLLVHIADRVLNRPLLLTPEKASTIMSVLSGRIGINSPEASRFAGSEEPQTDEDGNVVRNKWGDQKMKPYRITKSGTAVITITGSLVNRGAWVGASSGLTSYEGIKHQVQSAAADPNVNSIILDMDSPGGEAVGAFEMAQVVRETAAKKRTIAVVNGMAASAAYAIASGASEIVTTETGVSGSIGVVLLHADFSEALADEGIKPTLIFAGAHKVDGNPFEPLSDAVKSDLQAEVSAFYEQFLATVAKGRGTRMSADAARATEARTFIGQAAVDVGLADRVGTFESVLAELSRGSQGRSSSPSMPKGNRMSENTGAPAADNAGITKYDLDAATAAAHAEGAAEANARMAAILASDDVKGRERAALDLALKSPGMAADAVISFVSANITVAEPKADYAGHKAAAGGIVIDPTSPTKPEQKKENSLLALAQKTYGEKA